MATGWSVMDALNKSSKAAADDRPKARFRTRDISIRKMYSNERNFYSMPDIEELAQQIMAVGLIENLAVTYDPCDAGEYRIIAGERRWRALNLLLEKGHEEFEIVTCQIKTPAEGHEETVQLIIANAYRNKTVADMLEEEKRLKESLQYMKENGLALQGYRLDSGRLRDIIADIMNMTATKIAQIESINKHLIPEFTEELKEDRLTFSAAYEISGMPQEAQKQMLEKHGEDGLTLKDVREAKQETAEVEQKAGGAGQKVTEEEQPKGNEGSGQQSHEMEDASKEDDGWQQPQPRSITSLCYSCKRYRDCNIKTSTCVECYKYIDKTGAEKTAEQRYSEEQDAIDRETAKRLREMAQEEKMRHLPSETGQEHPMVHRIKLGSESFDDAVSGRKDFELRKNDRDYRVGDVLELTEFKAGMGTGRICRKEVTCILDGFTGLEDGYCIMGCKAMQEGGQTDREGPGAGQEAREQPPLPRLKNNDQRKAWLGAYKEWGLWYRDGNIGADYYKYDFSNGARLVIEAYHEKTRYMEDHEISFMHLIGGPEPPKGQYGIGRWTRHEKYSNHPDSESELVEFLKELQKQDAAQKAV